MLEYATVYHISAFPSNISRVVPLCAHFYSLLLESINYFLLQSKQEVLPSHIYFVFG